MPAKDPILKKKGKMLRIVKDLKERMVELETLKKDIELKEVRFKGSPKKSKEILEEIKVPSLQILKESNTKE